MHRLTGRIMRAEISVFLMPGSKEHKPHCGSTKCETIRWHFCINIGIYFLLENFMYLIDRKHKMWKDREEDIRTELL